MPKYIDLTGKQFGRWRVIDYSHTDSNAYWNCVCECGRERRINGAMLRQSKSKSCGCIRNHGDRKRLERLHCIWCNMKRRCDNPGQKTWKYYGARGIKVFKGWLHDYPAFKVWALNNGYTKELSIDRIDNDGDYTPENCRWATSEEQANNKSSNIDWTFNGKTQNITQWGKETGILQSTLFSRYYSGWSIERILTTPVRKRNK